MGVDLLTLLAFQVGIKIKSLRSVALEKHCSERWLPLFRHRRKTHGIGFIQGGLTSFLEPSGKLLHRIGMHGVLIQLPLGVASP